MDVGSDVVSDDDGGRGCGDGDVSSSNIVAAGYLLPWEQ